jgi:hypothetical protein
MGPLTLQLLILVSSFLFYRILRSGFESWKAVIIDFGIIMFLFGLQYYLQKKQQQESIGNKDDDSNNMLFPANALSSLLGVQFPNKIAMNKSSISKRPEYGCYLQLANDLFVQPMQRKTLQFTNKINSSDSWKNNKFQVNSDGFYIVQITCDIDVVPDFVSTSSTDVLEHPSFKLTLKGNINEIEKTVHNGENSFILYFKGKDNIHFELENFKNNIMLQETTTVYIIKL